MSDTPAIHVITLGCPKNEVDSDCMLASLQASAYRTVETIDDADLVVVNTCAFIREATEQSIDTVLALAGEWKAASPDRRIVVTGCMVSRYGTDLVEALTEADAFVPVAEEDGILEQIERLTGFPAHRREVETGRTLPGPFAYLQVSDGCHRACAYCTIPAIRGPYRSRPLDEIVAEARMLVSTGAKELILIGQDISAYGRDLDGPEELPQVVTRVATESGAERVRLMYVQPDGVTDELLKAMSSLPNVCRYLDIPLQHASAPVLRRMRRSGDAASFLHLLGRIRRILTGISLRTTLIAGFPGETEEDVALAEEFLRSAAFDHVGVFTFSPEEGTEAATLDGQLPEEVRRARAQRLRDVADDVGFARAAMRSGTVERILVDLPDEDGEVVGRTCGQAPDIDGVVLLDREMTPGTLIDVRIVDSVAYDLIAEVL
ncbi:MAG: 30S ribosomal protein S12 methylthiotransferase RimO [Coriobacteriia bacterium]|nr:30S ribosomal protein S12 methylthiotransferase RimO [Coriobacteriia bacterium]